jgi:hypothetical protein
MAKRTLTQKYNDVIMDIAMKRNGIKAESYGKLTQKNWEKLIANANGDITFAKLAVTGYFDSVGSDYLEGHYEED